MEISRVPSSSPLDIQVGLPARDQVRLQASVNEQGRIVSFRLTGVGCPEFLNQLAQLRAELTARLKAGPVSGFELNEISLPQGASHGAMLFRELLLRAQGRWNPPYKEDEICHCRAVPTARVDRAIVCGSHTIQQVARETSAGTSCGTCRTDTEALIRYRMGG